MFRRSTKSLTSAKWLGTVAGIAGALLIALNVGGTIVGIGFVFFAVSAAAWVVAGWRMGEPALIASWSDAHCVIIVGNWEEPSGASRLIANSSGKRRQHTKREGSTCSTRPNW